MNNILENKLSAYQKVQAFLTLHTTDTASIASVATTKAEFDAVVTKILNSAGISSIDITGYTVQKQNKRIETTKALQKITVAMGAYFSLNNKPQEAEKCDLTLAKLNALRDNDFYTYSQQMQAMAVPVIASLAAFGALPADNAALLARNAEFLQIIQEPRSRISERSAEFGNLERLFADADAILTNKLDKLMLIFQIPNPTLYDAYLNARAIDDTGSVTTADYEGTLDPKAIKVLATIPYLASRLYKVKNYGTTPIQFGLGEAPNEVIAGTATVVQPGTLVQRLSANLALKGDLFILENPDDTHTSDFKVWIEE